MYIYCRDGAAYPLDLYILAEKFSSKRGSMHACMQQLLSVPYHYVVHVHINFIVTCLIGDCFTHPLVYKLHICDESTSLGVNILLCM